LTRFSSQTISKTTTMHHPLKFEITWLLLDQMNQSLQLYVASVGRFLVLCAIVGFPFILPRIYTYLALPKNFMEVRNEEIEGYNPDVFFHSSLVSRGKPKKVGKRR